MEKCHLSKNRPQQKIELKKDTRTYRWIIESKKKGRSGRYTRRGLQVEVSHTRRIGVEECRTVRGGRVVVVCSSRWRWGWDGRVENQKGNFAVCKETVAHRIWTGVVVLVRTVHKRASTSSSEFHSDSSRDASAASPSATLNATASALSAHMSTSEEWLLKSEIQTARRKESGVRETNGHTTSCC